MYPCIRLKTSITAVPTERILTAVPSSNEPILIETQPVALQLLTLRSTGALGTPSLTVSAVGADRAYRVLGARAAVLRTGFESAPLTRLEQLDPSSFQAPVP